MNIPIEKPLIDIHSNICYAMKQNNKQLKQLLQLEMMIYHSEDPKLIIKQLETKVAKQIRIEHLYKLLVLFSLTQSGLKKDDFIHLQRIVAQNYGY